MLDQQANHRLVDWSLMDWAQVTRAFNMNFQGRLLPGDSTVRPQRTEGGLRSARPRIPEIVSLTGIAPREKGKKKEKKEKGEQKGGKETEKGGKKGGPKK